jgi:hypothetical protein
MTALLQAARREGLTMGSVHGDRHIGWTTDELKAEACREHGLTVLAGYNVTGPCGWEISTPTQQWLDLQAALEREAMEADQEKES